jgi:hypothetical protein
MKNKPLTTPSKKQKTFYEYILEKGFHEKQSSRLKIGKIGRDKKTHLKDDNMVEFKIPDSPFALWLLSSAAIIIGGFISNTSLLKIILGLVVFYIALIFFVTLFYILYKLDN